jgi:hypothetical protein
MFDVALGIRHAVRMRLIIICGLPGSILFFHIILQKTRIKKGNWTQSVCLVSFTNFVWNIFNSKKNWSRYDKNYIGRHVKYSSFWSDVKETCILKTVFR